MRNRSRLFIFSAALGGCLILFACVVALGFAGYFVLSQGNPLAALISAPVTVNRIVYVGNDANIYLVDPTGTQKTQLTKDGDRGTSHAYDFPTWAPDNRRIAFVGISLSGGSPQGATLYSTDTSGTRQTPLFKSDQSIPIYLYWSPDSRYVSFLTSSGANDLALLAANTDKENSAEELGTGSPLYFAWSPDSRRVFMHIGGTRSDSAQARLALLPFGQKNSVQSIASNPGPFAAPQWSPDGQHLLFSQEDQNQHDTVAVANAQGNEAKVLFDYQGRVSFAWSPAGNRIAYLITPADSNIPNFGKVQIVDANGQNARDVSDEHALAFYWSPDGRRLAYLTVQLAPGNSGSRFPGLVQQTSPQFQMQWKVLDLETDKTSTVATFSPTDNFINILPFFDQYARSATFWSPDSKSLVYANAESSGDGTLYVAEVSGKDPPRKIGEGTIAYWSWK